MNKKTLFEMAHTRVESQRKKMEACIKLGICPFCMEHLARWHDAPIEMTGRFWVITANDNPYDGVRYHYLAIARNHIYSILELPREASAELFSLFSQFCILKNIPGAAILMRFGEMVYTGATVSHLHAHIISGASREEVLGAKYPDSFITTVLGYKVPK